MLKCDFWNCFNPFAIRTLTSIMFDLLYWWHQSMQTNTNCTFIWFVFQKHSEIAYNNLWMLLNELLIYGFYDWEPIIRSVVYVSGLENCFEQLHHHLNEKCISESVNAHQINFIHFAREIYRIKRQPIRILSFIYFSIVFIAIRAYDIENDWAFHGCVVIVYALLYRKPLTLVNICPQK